MLNEVKHLALSKRDSSAAPQTCPRAKRRNDTHHLTCDGPAGHLALKPASGFLLPCNRPNLRYNASLQEHYERFPFE
jgi:hypothetical protein